MKIKIAINGFGRIGRLLLRQILEESDFEVVAVNDLGSAENLAYLFKHDSIYHEFPKEVEVVNGVLKVDGREIKFLNEKNPSKLPWKEMDIDVVIESTGVFESFEKAGAHILAGAKRVVITAPAKDTDGENGKTVLVGVNDSEFGKTLITSNGSCTTNAAVPVLKVMLETVGIKKATLNTVHAYTATQNLVDGPAKGDDFNRGRAGAYNIIPSSTGASSAVERILSELEGKFDGVSLRVPTICGSIADITFISGTPTTREEINEIFKKASKEERWQGILGVAEEPIVSSDIIGDTRAAVVDLLSTTVTDGDLVKLLIWYDNEWGYVKTLVNHMVKVAEKI